MVETRHLYFPSTVPRIFNDDNDDDDTEEYTMRRVSPWLEQRGLRTLTGEERVECSPC